MTYKHIERVKETAKRNEKKTTTQTFSTLCFAFLRHHFVTVRSDFLTPLLDTPHTHTHTEWWSTCIFTTTKGKQSHHLCLLFSFLFVITMTLTSYQMTSDIVNHIFRPINFTSNGRSFSNIWCRSKYIFRCLFDTKLKTLLNEIGYGLNGKKP